MNIIKTKLGTAYYDEETGQYVLTRDFDSLSLLLDKEKEIKKRFKSSKFELIDTVWELMPNPLYRVARVFNDDSERPVSFSLKVILDYVPSKFK